MFLWVAVFILPAILCSMAIKNEEKIYEVSFHLVPTIDADALPAVFERVKGVVSGQGEVLGEEEPTRRELAYTIRHTVRQSDGSYNRYDEAYFGSVKFRALRGGVKQIEDALSGDGEVLRFLLLETVADDTRVGEVLPDAEPEDEVKEGDAQGADSGGADDSGPDGKGAVDGSPEGGGEESS